MGLFSQHFQQALQNKSTDLNADGIISWQEAFLATVNSMKGSNQTPVIEGGRSNEGLFAATQESAALKKFSTAHVLLVGINEYKGGFNLRGAVNDVQGFAKLMGDKRRVLAGSAKVTLLIDRQATKSSILGEISDLVDASGPGDISIIYFSGHVLVEGQKEQHKSFIPYDYQEGAEGISIPSIAKELGRAKGLALIIVDG